MARTMIERLVDDIDGSVATQSVSLGVDGRMVQVDLNDQHANELRMALDPFIKVARRVRGGTGRGRGAGRPAAPADAGRNAAIRQWALEQGVELPSRGRIAGGVQQAYDGGDVAALYAAAGLEFQEPTPPKRSRRRTASADFSDKE